jgi:sugar lactone lactonase YvrE
LLFIIGSPLTYRHKINTFIYSINAKIYRKLYITKSQFMINITFTKLFCASLLMAFSVGANAQGIITTIAGTGMSGYAGDGGPATAAKFANPSGVATDAAGNIYIADRNNHRVRMISATDGTITTVAGTGDYGYSGMGGPALVAKIKYPNAIYVDAAGNYFVTDNYTDVAYKVSSSTGYITNICGNGTQGGDGDGGPGNCARMCIPNGVYGDNVGNTYIVDIGNSRIRKVDGSTGIVKSIAGGLTGYSGNGGPALLAAFSGINGVCADAAGNVYISDRGNRVVRKIDAMGIIRTIAGTPGVAGNTGDGGNALSAKLNSPGALFVNSAGYLFICDQGSHVVRVMNLASGIINTVAGNGTGGFAGDGGAATLAKLSSPTGVWQDATGSIYIADAGNNRIRKISGSGYKQATMANTLTEGQMSVFPNPSNGTFSVQTATQLENATLEVFNVLGEKVHAEKINSQFVTVALNQPAGVYTVQLNSNSGILTHKITIAK